MVELRNVDKNNWLSVIRLSCAEDQQNRIFEKTIASNCLSLVQASMEEGWTTQALYDEEIVVGFVMFGYSAELQGLEICRLMIDHRFQGRGYGREALHQTVEVLREQYPEEPIFICFQEENTAAKKLYERYGFINSGSTIEGNVEELIYVLLPEPATDHMEGAGSGSPKIHS
ncbi:GNAT family N-acetyltransferase [Planococcus lenghuensis]|uniref:N-acetyltransferase domain-containing protein n=1 Tax=Planococcus lenghuensis TaxID=2213202 RepID=A0A1Q2KWN9_9BACL|nr:GNAT family N-acetyltransferase [Planococcus lenghuensis]AQQ52635.1 hypothetical protein B0X71_05670 [Planococcus lenghuensis]